MNKKTPSRSRSTSTKKSINSEAVRQLAELLDDTGLTEIEYEEGSTRIRVSRAAAAAHAAPMPHPQQAPAPAPSESGAGGLASAAAEADLSSHPGAVTSPMVGTVYMAPEPGSPNFIAEGDTVAKGQTLMLVEAMKTFNEIKAPAAGTVKQVLVENTQPVEFGDVLVVIE
jgi:acetyl-CoA carboxylase biotin carboxyl carrier protein